MRHIAGAAVLVVLCAGSASSQVLRIGKMVIPTTKSAVVEQGRVLVPMRETCELVGIHVAWDGDAKAAIGTFEHLAPYGEPERWMTTFTVRPGVRTVELGDQTVALDVAPRLVGDVLYVPARLVARVSDVPVEWYADEAAYRNPAMRVPFDH